MTKAIDPNISNTDYVKDGVLYVGNEYNGNVLIESSSDLTDIAEFYQPGAMAHTAGWANSWERAADGDWEPIGGSN